MRTEVNLNATIGLGIGLENVYGISQLPELAKVELPEENVKRNLLDHIKSNYQKWDPNAPDYKKTECPVDFRIQLNSDLVLVSLAKENSYAIRMHNSFSVAPGSTNTKIWTKYSDRSVLKPNFQEIMTQALFVQGDNDVDIQEGCFAQVGKMMRVFSVLKSEIRKLTEGL